MRIATRFPIERFVALDHEIRAGRFPNAKTFGDEIGVCSRTIQRDIEFMRDRLKAPIVFDPPHNGYFYSDPNYRFNPIALTEGELIAVFVAERALSQYRGAPFEDDLKRAFAKIQAALTDRITVDLGRLGGSYSFHTTAPVTCPPERFHTLATAIERSESLEILYGSVSHDEPTRREIDPLHLASVDGQWYLVAYCQLRQSVRLFVPSRIESISVTGRTFKPPTDFNINDYLSESLSVFRGEPGVTHQIRIRLRGLAARLAPERIWHASQRIEPTPEGDLILSLQLSHLREIERWVLSWGADAEVLEPDELRKRIAATHKRAARIYHRE